MNVLKRFIFGGSEFEGLLANSGVALLRIFTGITMAFGHGIKKLPPSDQFIETIGKIGFPAPDLFAYAAGAAEFFGGILLALGLATRPSAIFVFFVMFVAASIRHADAPFATRELPLLFGVVMLAFILIGSGKYGLDALIRRRWKQNP